MNKIKSKSQRNIIIVLALVIIIIIVGVVYYNSQKTNKNINLDAFAQCLKSKGATFYGAFWCPHCQNQKALFGASAKLLPYVECSTPDANGQLQVCADKQITGYPTWVFADGNRQSGELDLNTLAAKTGCGLSQ